jgi:AcrR family transcriptional regulator
LSSRRGENSVTSTTTTTKDQAGQGADHVAAGAGGEVAAGSVTAGDGPEGAAIEVATTGGRPMRADAKRNYDKLLTAARDAFNETGASTSLEEIARRAGVGIGTLYRHFPTRQALLEAVYIGEVQQLCSATRELLEMEPWESFVALTRRLVGYLATKKALAHELFNYVDREAAFFQTCRADLFIAGEPVLWRAQEAKAVRADTDFAEVVQMVGGIAKIEASQEQREHILEIALDGLRYRG